MFMNMNAQTKGTTSYNAISNGYYNDVLTWENGIAPTSLISSGENLSVDSDISVEMTSDLVFGSNAGGKQSIINIGGYLGGNYNITVVHKDNLTILNAGVLEVDTFTVNNANSISVVIDSGGVLIANVLIIETTIINNGKIIADEVQCSTLITGSGTIENPSALPIELLSFDVINKDTYIDINWTTSTETNNDYFVVEKSTDGLNYYEIGNISGAGNSNIVNHYNYSDYDVNHGTTYYRLKQVDYDGNQEIFDAKTINIKEDENIIVVRQHKIEISSKTINNEVVVCDISGKTIHNEKYNGKINLDIVISGIYIISINSVRYKIYVD